MGEVVKEVGGGLDGRRGDLHRVLSDPDVAVIVVEHRDRLARFGVEYLESALAATGRRLIILDPEEIVDGLVRDMTEVLTSMCAGLYERREAEDRVARAVAVVMGEVAE